MRILKTINLVLLVLLGIFSGSSKILRSPQEMEFFQSQMGFSASTIVLFGTVQLVAGVLLVFGKTRIIGADILLVTLCISTIIIFMAGKIGFGFFSILPIVMAAIVVKGTFRKAIDWKKIIR